MQTAYMYICYIITEQTTVRSPIWKRSTSPIRDLLCFIQTSKLIAKKNIEERKKRKKKGPLILSIVRHYKYSVISVWFFNGTKSLKNE